MIHDGKKVCQNRLFDIKGTSYFTKNGGLAFLSDIFII